MNNKTVTLLALVIILGFVFDRTANWAQRHPNLSQLMVETTYFDLIRKQSECFENRAWKCIGRMNKAIADLAAICWSVISDHELVKGSVAPKFDEILAWHESLSPTKFVVADDTQEESRASQNGKQSRPFNYTIWPTPYFVNGELRGFQVFPGTDRDAFYSLGFYAGDVIVEIDGQPLDDPALAFEQFLKLIGGQPVQVRVERDGQSKVIEIPADLLNAE